jgi:hypothetical protein
VKSLPASPPPINPRGQQQAQEPRGPDRRAVPAELYRGYSKLAELYRGYSKLKAVPGLLAELQSCTGATRRAVPGLLFRRPVPGLLADLDRGYFRRAVPGLLSQTSDLYRGYSDLYLGYLQTYTGATFRPVPGLLFKSLKVLEFLE